MGREKPQDGRAGYDEALRRIEECESKGGTTLNLAGLGLKALPPQIGRLTAITRLDLSNNHLTTLPQEVGRLNALTQLSLLSNQLITLPPEIGCLTALTELNLFANQLTALPSGIGRLTALTSLDVGSNKLSTLPAEVGRLRALTELYLSNNRLTDLSPMIGRLTLLAQLNLRNNQITTLPPEIGRLAALTQLHLSGNQLTALPPEIGQLTGLTQLNLRHNRLFRLPPEIGRLTRLTVLYLHDNPGLGLPAEVLGPTRADVLAEEAAPKPPGEILEYYFSTRGGEGRALREVKLIFIGRGEVGKSTLVDVLRGRKFVKHRKRTDGIAITPWEVALADGSATVQMWDFGGQEIMHGTHQFFLTHRSLYVVMVDGRHDHARQDAEYWLKFVRAFGGESPVLVVMNRQKAHPFDLDREHLAKKYGVNVEHFFRTDYADAKTTKPVRKAILAEAARMLAAEERFPVKCWAVKDRLANMKAHGEDYLSDDPYTGLCAELGVAEAEAQQKLLRRLADLGTVVSFPDDVKLSEFSVLNPEWATDGIYRIVTNEPLRERRHGLLKPSTLRELLPKKRWPQARHLQYLLDLMAKFELCFPVDHEDGTVLVPELLEDKTPPLADWDPAACVVFLYKYPVLPHGILPRFITRTHTLSEERLRWRTGVVLGKDGAEAVIKADYEAGTMSVWVRGKYADTKRALLTIVRHHFGEIHGRITGLDPQELVAVPGHPEVTVPYWALVKDKRRGKRTIAVTLDGERVDWPIEPLLDGVESADQTRQAEERLERLMPRDGGAGATTHIHVDGDYINGDQPMGDKNTTTTIKTGDVYGQVGGTLTNCTNIIQQQAPGKKKDVLDQLRKDVQKLIESLPKEKKEEAPQVAENLEMLIKQATSPKPNRKWYSVSAEGLLEAATWVKDFSGQIGGTLKNLGGLLGADFLLPDSK